MILLLYRFSIGDYSTILVDFKLDDIAGYRVNISTLKIRKLIGDKARYNEKEKELIVSHKINKKLDTL